jgi:hypothetical protein
MLVRRGLRSGGCRWTLQATLLRLGTLSPFDAQQPVRHYLDLVRRRGVMCLKLPGRRRTTDDNITTPGWKLA